MTSFFRRYWESVQDAIEGCVQAYQLFSITVNRTKLTRIRGFVGSLPGSYDKLWIAPISQCSDPESAEELQTHTEVGCEIPTVDAELVLLSPAKILS